MKLNSCNIYYEIWQLQCCGKEFQIGESICWSGKSVSSFWSVPGVNFDYLEEHHGREEFTMKGCIDKITGVVAANPPHTNLSLEESKIELYNLTEVDGWELQRALKDTEEICYNVCGYVVTLKNVEITSYDESLEYDYL